MDVVALGELLIDFTENGVSGQGNPLFEANPGGAPCNVLAMLSRLGHRTAFIGKVGNDFFGKQLEDAITEVGIDAAGLLKDEDSKVLSKIVLYLIIPCVILNAFQVDYTPETVRGLLVAFAASLLMQVVLLFAVSALGRVFHLDAVEITSVYYSNSGNLIVPLVTAVLGAEWVLYSCVYMSVQLVFFWTHCKKVISREASYDWKKIVLNLNIISIFVGILLFFTGIRLPALVNNTLHSVGSMVGPASMIVTGMLFAGMDFRQIFANKRIYFVTFLRLIAVPLMALVLLKLSHLADLSADGPTLILIVFLAIITPSASTVTQMCQVYGNDSRYASAINVMTTLFSIITMPLMVMLFEAVI